MKSLFIPAVLLTVAATAAAQTPAPAAAADPQAVVATINGENITRQQLDQMWNRLGTQMRDQYEKNGGKSALLDNYIRKRLVLQEATKAGFEKRPDVAADMKAAADSALFDRYIRDVVASQVVTDDVIRKYYDEHKNEFAAPESIKARHIIIMPNGAGPRPKSDEEAAKLIQKIATELTAAPGPTVDRFAAAAVKYSEDGVAAHGGDLGWVTKGSLDPTFEEAAFKQANGTMVGPIKTRFGYHLIWVEDHRPAGTQTFDDVKSSLREFLVSQHAADIMTAVTRLTNELRANSRIAVHPENIR